MKTRSTKKTTVCFGEILWDMLPTGKKPGGAPMNVAYHLQKLGLQSYMISRVGQDIAGEELIDFVQSIGLPADYIQKDNLHKTSEVLATIKENHEVSYDIVFPVAWDFINWQPEYEALLRRADAFIFGSLGSRNSQSQQALFRMLEYTAYNVFDVNIREPYYSQELIAALLHRSHLVKVNAAELMMIAGWYDASCNTEERAIAMLFKEFNIKEVLITKGSKGATYYTASFRYDYPAYSICVADTVGSGDSFLAAFLAMKLGEQPVEVTLDYAVAMGAFITAQSGACPAYSKFDLDRFIWKRKLGIEEKSI
ncbi:carbohydrate kinase [Pedobacter nutrimenti]|uniref:carbohydrate kinase family protein n=1 Tax=Pedobacter nutrimenti TaxID=1241337 RepID=UPI00292CD32A|nr:carbohydrate kinase [Pedobacter nutrimenti]